MLTILLVSLTAGHATAQPTTQQPRLGTCSRFRQLPPISIRPAGWLLDYTLLVADSWPLQQARDRHPEIYGSYSQRLKYQKDGSLSAGPDYAAYFGDGFVRLSHLLPQSHLAKELPAWLEQVLASQDPNGYLGSVDHGSKPAQMGGMQIGPSFVSNDWFEILDVFNQAVTIQALLRHVRSNGEQP